MFSLVTRCIAYIKTIHFSSSFWFLITSSFINYAGNFVFPFYALYLTTFRHFSIQQATLIISLMGLGPLAAGIFGGLLADTFGHRSTILMGLLTGAMIMLLLGFVSDIPAMIVLSILYGVFKILHVRQPQQLLLISHSQISLPKHIAYAIEQTILVQLLARSLRAYWPLSHTCYSFLATHSPLSVSAS